MNKEEFEKEIGLSDEIYRIYFRKNEIEISDRRGHTANILCTPTHTDWTKHNAAIIKKWVSENKKVLEAWTSENKQKEKEAAKKHKAWLKTPAGKLSTAKEQALTLAKKAGLQHDEHGGYSRGDYHKLSVVDVVFKKPELKKHHAVGKILAVVEDSRKRIYSKSYMRNFGAGHRSDLYLVGTNENGVPFVHGISKNCKTVSDAIAWVWNNNRITARQGDVAVSTSNLKSPGLLVENISIHDNHHYTGELKRNGATYIRNGTLFHTKQQHPDVVVGNEWMKVVIARRVAVGGSSD